MARVRPTALAGERHHLIDGPAAFERYRALIDEQNIRCFRCAE